MDNFPLHEDILKIYGGLEIPPLYKGYK